MPAPGKLWRHVIISTRCSWLHGDKRGFRHRKHKIHSSGDYRNPPPKEEHEGLRDYFEELTGDEIHLEKSLRPRIGRAIVEWLQGCDHRVLAVAVAKVHAHALVELPNFMPKVREIVGHAKRKSSRAVKNEMPGSIWGKGGKYKPVTTRSHLFNACGYILYDQGPDAWTWSYRDQVPGGRFGRKRPPKPKNLPSGGRAYSRRPR